MYIDKERQKERARERLCVRERERQSEREITGDMGVNVETQLCRTGRHTLNLSLHSAEQDATP